MIIMKESYFGINLRVLKERPDNKKDDWKTNSNHPFSDTTFNIVLEFASPLTSKNKCPAYCGGCIGRPSLRRKLRRNGLR